ncbi:MAG: hypothetical protein VXA34_00090 [Gammaproteobacteria bacterium]|jgi:hypothetical protein
MANTNVAFGLKPIGLHGGAPATQGQTAYYISGTASAIYQGSPVKVETTGGTIQVASTAADGEQLLGAFAGCEYVDATTGEKKFSNYWPGSGSANTSYDIIGYVYDNPAQKFLCVADGSMTDKATARANIFKTVDFDNGDAGSTTTGLSTGVVDISTANATDPSLPLMIVGIQEDVDNQDYAAAGIAMIVKINNHVLLGNDADATIA